MIALKVVVLAIVGALIGWLTNIIAIKLIFRPLNPITIPVINLSIQGLIPKRREEMAKSIGDVIEDELLSMHEIINKLIKEENISQIKFMLKRKINDIVSEKLPSIIPSTFKNMIYSYIDDLVENEGENIIKDLSEKIVDKATEEISLSEIVQEKINSFELDKIEKIVISVAKKELKHIEVLGGILGFIIGLLQGLIVILL
ncbi:DUF445 domain-containing protein [Brassicibacter mesophilus]|uniref:DUF445 domain-containing protein n=1 Tax=Brassicibacter mesophilus TaxID=745119 RepID=UPI003D242A12